jgi:threonine dehydrogenase-like Zn-dependent dehydrogenase
MQAGEVGVIEKPIPKPGPNEAAVRTTTALVCTSDVHTVNGAIRIEPNRTLGHEAVGVVHALGSAVRGFSVGDQVGVGAITPCFSCGYCQRGFTSQCQGMLGGYKFTGQRDGNMAEYFVVNDAQANLTRSRMTCRTRRPSTPPTCCRPASRARRTPNCNGARQRRSSLRGRSACRRRSAAACSALG